MTETTDQTAPDYASMPARQLLLILKQRVQGIGKNEENRDQGFNFRGIDTVVNTCGPIERELGLLVFPEVVEETSEQHEYGSRKTLGFRTRVKVRYHWLASNGDELIVGPVAGEAIDTGDKGTAKAMSVACRIMYLQTLTIPTDEPDPDSQSYEVAKPEAQISDPKIIAALEKKITDADSRAALEKIFKTDIKKAYETDATITKADADRLSRMIGGRLPEFDQAAKA
jgi:hypothetical protein